MKQKIYISGKIGEDTPSEATILKFKRAEDMLKSKGFEVFNPCSELWQCELKKKYKEDTRDFAPFLDGHNPSFYAYALLRDMMAMSIKDAVYFLKDFHLSPGARAEYEFAKATGMSLYFEEKYHAKSYLNEKICDDLLNKRITSEEFDRIMKTGLDKYIIVENEDHEILIKGGPGAWPETPIIGESKYY